MESLGNRKGFELEYFPMPEGFWRFVEEHMKKLDPKKSFKEEQYLQCLRLYHWLSMVYDGNPLNLAINLYA